MQKHHNQMKENRAIDNNTYFDAVTTMLKEGQDVTINVRGASMLPFLAESRGDQIILEGAEAGTPDGCERVKVNVNDIVLFRLGNRYFLHRILKINDNDIAEIQGDGIINAKEHCHRDNILARVTTIIRSGKDAINTKSSTYRRNVRIWMILKPFRRPMLWLWKRLFL